jgi:hypothetical protein
MVLWGHGWPCGSESFTSVDVNELHNGPVLPFWINISCSTGNFANEQQCSAWGYDCLGENLMHRSDHGTIAFFGATKAVTNHTFGHLILEALYDQSYPMIGQAVAEAKLRLGVEQLGTKRDLYAFNLLGDPTLNLFLGEETGYGGACDLVVRARDVVVTPEPASYGDEIAIECRVTNEGPQDIGPDVVVAFDLYDRDGQLFDCLTDTLTNLTAWKADTARVTWTPSSDEIGAYELVVWADPEDVIDELHEWNNVTDDSTRFYVYF